MDKKFLRTLLVGAGTSTMMDGATANAFKNGYGGDVGAVAGVMSSLIILAGSLDADVKGGGG